MKIKANISTNISKINIPIFIKRPGITYWIIITFTHRTYGQQRQKLMRPKVQLQVWNIILRKQQLEDQWEFCIYICTHKILFINFSSRLYFKHRA